MDANTPPEAASEPTASGQTSAEPPTRRERFAAWRAGRPFVGGVLTMLSGLVLWFSGRLELDNFEIQLGIEGMQSTLLPVALVALGALVLGQPQFRVFYGVIALAISVYSLLGVNLGGFGVGMALGVVGGILMVSWLPKDRAASGEGAGGSGAADDEARVVADGPVAATDDQGATSGERSAAYRSMAVGAVAALALAAPALPAAPAAGATPAGAVSTEVCWDPLDWIESVTCEGDEATPSPSPSVTDDPAGEEADGAGGAGSDADDGGADDGAGGADDGASGAVDDLLGAAGEAVPDGEAEGKGADGKDSKDSKDGDEADEKDGEKPTSKKEAEEEVTEAARLELGPCARITFGGEYDIKVSLPGDCGTPEDANVFSLDGDLETRDLQLPLTGINGIDVVNVPVTNDGPRRDALRISVDEVKVPGFWLRTYAYNDGKVGGTETDAEYVSMQGDAQMYVSAIHANLPDEDDFVEMGQKIAGGASLVELLLGLTDARLGFMGATADTQVWSEFRQQVWEE